MVDSYPLAWPDGWTRSTVSERRPRSPFQTTFTKARADLLRELGLLGASGVVISSWLPVRRDGLPLAEAARRSIPDPGVAVYFALRGRPMVMARDFYMTVHDNLRSIGLAVSHLRGLERHGGGIMVERAFSGFAAISAPDRRGWRAVLGVPADAEFDVAETRYRELAKRWHPDQPGGDAERFREIADAIREARAESRR